MTRTIVHLVRHGEVENPDRLLYGRLPEYHLSARGQRMAERLGEYFAGNDLAAVTDAGGVMTPATGLGRLLVDRLRRQGFTIETVRR